MGFCSGTDIFDPVAGQIIGMTISEDDKVVLLRTLINALWDHDWDCESDSAYWDDPIVRRVFGDLQPDMFEDEDEELDA